MDIVSIARLLDTALTGAARLTVRFIPVCGRMCVCVWTRWLAGVWQGVLVMTQPELLKASDMMQALQIGQTETQAGRQAGSFVSAALVQIPHPEPWL